MSDRSAASAPTSALDKEIRTGGATRVTVRVEVINLFNTPWYTSLASTDHRRGKLRAGDDAGEPVSILPDHGSLQLVEPPVADLKFRATTSTRRPGTATDGLVC